MKGILVFIGFLLVYQPCTCRSLNEEDSVVSVYTTLPSTAGAGASLDVYRQIADNIAERITQPIYRFFGISNTTSEKATTKRPFEHIELNPTELTPPKTDKNDTKQTDPADIKPNEIPDRDVEELSESFRKSNKKPEKITLFSSYVPVKENIEINNSTADDDDNSLELDDVDPDDVESIDSGKDSSIIDNFVYFLEFIGSIIQLLWGGFLAIFRPSTYSR